MIGYVLTYSVKNSKERYVEKKFYHEENEAVDFGLKLCTASNVVGINLSKIKYEIVEINTLKTSLIKEVSKNGK